MGFVVNVCEIGVWINVFDLGFNLYVCEDLIVVVWVVKKLMSDGIVMLFELFDW